MIDLANEIRKSYSGNPWHGINTMYLLSSATPDKVFSHPIPGAHSIAELVAHLTVWTEEVAERMSGKHAKTPVRGDWPLISGNDNATWNVLMDDFMMANERLIALCANFKENDWDKPVIDNRGQGIGTQMNNEELLSGLLQHHAYHSGQIALLLKF